MASCAAKYRPTDPVLAGWERSIKFPVEKPHENLVYSGRQAGTTAPVVPLLAFGAAFDLDLVVIPKEGDFDMLELARVAQPTGPAWMVLETSAQNGDQTMIANLDNLAEIVPEIPLTRQKGDLIVTDKSTEFTVDVAATWTNGKGQKVEATFMGDPPTKIERHRNGKTFGHSANQLLAVLDIPSQESLFKADVSIDGKGVKFKKIAGIVPGQFAMEQVQGGLATGAFKIVPGPLAGGGADWSKVVVNAAGAESTVKASPDMLLRMGLASNATTVGKCWKDRFAAKTDLKGGKMAFDFTVTSGVVSNAKPAVLTGDGVFTDDELGKCVSAAMTAWALDSSLNGTVNWPFTFVAGDAEADLEPTVTLGMGTSQLAEPAAPAPAEGATDGATTTAAPDAPLYNFTTVHSAPGGGSVELKWGVTRLGDRVTVQQATELRTLTYNYRLVQGTFLELYSITVTQYGRATPTAAVTFNPPLPDVRWAFSGKRASTYIIDINGQQNYAYGEAEAYWTEGGPKVKVTGTAPDWVKERPMLTSITYSPDGSADVKIERVGE